MNRISQIYLIAFLAMLSACVPPEQPLEVSAPQKQADNRTIAEATAASPSDDAVDVTLDKAADNQSTSQQATITNKIAPVTDAEQPQQIAQAENAPTVKTDVKTDVKPEVKTEVKIVEKTEETTEPEPEPYNPIILIGNSQASIRATLGAEDLSFSNGSMTIAHYRQDSCMMLVFVTEADIISHIDLRDLEIGKPLDEVACYRELGEKKGAMRDAQQ